MSNKNKTKSEDTTVKVTTGQQPKLEVAIADGQQTEAFREAAVVDELMTIVDTAFETCDFDESIIKSVKAGNMYGCEPNEMEVTLKDGGVFSIAVTTVRGPKR